jgi:hypothetical protein
MCLRNLAFCTSLIPLYRLLIRDRPLNEYSRSMSDSGIDRRNAHITVTVTLR